MAKRPRKLQRSQARNSAPPPRLPIEWIEGRPMRLNKYLAHLGLGTRRECEQLIKSGKISVDGSKVDNPGLLVTVEQHIELQRQVLERRIGRVYLLANRRPGIEAAALPALIDLPELPEQDWFVVFERHPAIAGLSLLTNDKPWSDKLRQRAEHLRATLLLPGLAGPEEQVLTVEELRRFVPEPGRAMPPDVLQLVGLDKRDLPRGFYRFLLPQEIGRLWAGA